MFPPDPVFFLACFLSFDRSHSMTGTARPREQKAPCGRRNRAIASAARQGISRIFDTDQTLAALGGPVAALFNGAPAKAEGCPTAADAIDTDRPDTTNSSQTVPAGSLLLENG